MTTDKIFFQKFFRRGGNDKGGKMTEGIKVIGFYFESINFYKFH